LSLTNYAEDLVLKWLLTSNSATRPTNWYVGLFTAAPGETGGGTEVSGGSYARQSAAFTVSGTAPTEASNTASIEFPLATASWGTITYVGIFDASTAGNMITYAQLLDPADYVTALPKTVASGDILRINAGNLKIRLD